MHHSTHFDCLHLSIKVHYKLGQYFMQFSSYSTKRCNGSGKMSNHSNSRSVGGYGETLHRYISSTVHGRRSGVVSLQRGGNFVLEKFNRVPKLHNWFFKYGKVFMRQRRRWRKLELLVRLLKQMDIDQIKTIEMQSSFKS